MPEDKFVIAVGSNVVEMFPSTVLVESLLCSDGWVNAVNWADVDNWDDVESWDDVDNLASVVGRLSSDGSGCYKNRVKVIIRTFTFDKSAKELIEQRE